MYIGDRSDSPSPAIVSSEFPDVSLSGDGAAASSSGVKILQAKRLAAAQQKKKQLTGVKKSKCSAQAGCIYIWVVIFLLLNSTIHGIEIFYQTALNHGKLLQDNERICSRLS